jgi:hypothetical protein
VFNYKLRRMINQVLNVKICDWQPLIVNIGSENSKTSKMVKLETDFCVTWMSFASCDKNLMKSLCINHNKNRFRISDLFVFKHFSGKNRVNQKHVCFWNAYFIGLIFYVMQSGPLNGITDNVINRLFIQID